jgi:hypothetical protein
LIVTGIAAGATIPNAWRKNKRGRCSLYETKKSSAIGNNLSIIQCRLGAVHFFAKGAIKPEHGKKGDKREERGKKEATDEAE